MREPIVTIR